MQRDGRGCAPGGTGAGRRGRVRDDGGLGRGGALGLGALGLEAEAGEALALDALLLLLLALDRGGNVAWRDPVTLASLSGAAGFFALFVLVELRWAREPCAPKRIVTNLTLLASYLANLFANYTGDGVDTFGNVGPLRCVFSLSSYVMLIVLI